MNHLQHRPRPLHIVALALALAGGLGTAGGFAQTPPAAPPAGTAEGAIENFVRTQTAGLPGKVTVKLLAPGAVALPPCEAFEPFLPAGAAPRGRVSVGVRCHGDRPWTRFIQAYVSVEGSYFVATRAIDAGQTLGAGDFAERTGDLALLPRTVITDASELNGVAASNRIASGAPLRKDTVRGVVVIQQGQTVQLVAQGQGFVVSTEGKAMTRAAVGAVVQAKTRDGRLLSGVADEEGQIKLAQ